MVRPQPFFQIVLSSKERFIGRSASELSSWYQFVVVVEVLLDQSFERLERIKRVKAQPSGANLGPQRLDKGVRLGYVDLRDYMADLAHLGDAKVFGTSFGHHLYWRRDLNGFQSLANELSGSLGQQLGLLRPRDDSARTVVLDGVKVGSRTIEQSDDGDVDVSNWPGSRARMPIFALTG